MIRRIAMIAFACTLVLSSVAAAGGDDVLPRLDLDMLVFEDREHFNAVMSALIAEQELADLVAEASFEEFEGDEREASAFQDFANAIGFESLLIRIEAVTAELDKEGGVNEFNDPDDHQIPDPYFRGMLNPQGEIMVGGTIYRYHPNGYYEIDGRDVDTLDRIRQGEGVETGGNVRFTEFRSGGDCCRDNWSNVEFDTYAGGDRRMKSKQWIGNWGLYASVGARTKNQKKGLFGWWWGTKADVIGVRGSLMRAEKFGVLCTDLLHIDFNKVKHNKKKVSKIADWTLNAPQFPIWVKDYFDTTHWAEDAGGSAIRTLSMCDCREATASFTLPSVIDDSSNVVLNGTASENEDNFFLEVYRTNAVGSNTVTGPYWSNWFSGQVGFENLSAFYNFTDPSGNGTVYRVKLAVQNGCTNWDEQVRWVTIRDEHMHVTYRAHVKNLGWLNWVFDGATAGTTGQSRRMEAAQIELVNPGSTQICYRAHVKGNGWLGTVCDGATAGTTGQSRRMEAIQINLINPPPGCNVEYRAHVKGNGWLGWVSNGATAGTTGQSRRMEALQVKLVGCP